MTLMGDEELRRRFSENARLSSGKYDADKIASQWTLLFSQLK